MATRREFIVGLMASAALPAVAPTAGAPAPTAVTAESLSLYPWQEDVLQQVSRMSRQQAKVFAYEVVYGAPKGWPILKHFESVGGDWRRYGASVGDVALHAAFDDAARSLATLGRRSGKSWATAEWHRHRLEELASVPYADYSRHEVRTVAAIASGAIPVGSLVGTGRATDEGAAVGGGGDDGI